jgi:hypothetical protein
MPRVSEMRLPWQIAISSCRWRGAAVATAAGRRGSAACGATIRAPVSARAMRALHRRVGRRAGGWHRRRDTCGSAAWRRASRRLACWSYSYGAATWRTLPATRGGASRSWASCERRTPPLRCGNFRGLGSAGRPLGSSFPRGLVLSIPCSYALALCWNYHWCIVLPLSLKLERLCFMTSPVPSLGITALPRFQNWAETWVYLYHVQEKQSRSSFHVLG